MQSKKYFFQSMNSISQAYKGTACLTLIIVVGAILRWHDLGTESFWIDEIFTAHLIPQDSHALVQQVLTQSRLTRTAVYFLLAHFWTQSFGINEIALRSLSVVFGVLSIVMMYLVGRELFGRKVGLISAFLLAVSEFQIQNSQTARFYSLFVLLTLCSIYSYVAALRNRNTWVWIINSLINILLFYTHTYAVFVFMAEYFHYFIHWKQHKNTLIQWGLSQMLLLFAIIPSSIPMIRAGKISAGLGDSLGWINSPSFKDLIRTVYVYVFPQNYRHSWFFIGATFAAGLAFLIFSVAFLYYRKGENLGLGRMKIWFQYPRFPLQINSEFMLVVLWFVCPIIIPFFYSILCHPLFTDRYTICAAPAFYLMIAIAILRISRIVPVYISLGALMIVVLPGLQDYYAAPVNEQWREAAAYVQENSKPTDIVVYAPNEEGFQRKSFDWYYKGYLPGCGINSRIKDEKTFLGNISDCTNGYDRFWVIVRGTPEVVDRFKSFLLNPNQTAMRLIREHQLVGVSIYLFEWIK